MLAALSDWVPTWDLFVSFEPRRSLNHSVIRTSGFPTETEEILWAGSLSLLNTEPRPWLLLIRLKRGTSWPRIQALLSYYKGSEVIVSKRRRNSFSCRDKKLKRHPFPIWFQNSGISSPVVHLSMNRVRSPYEFKLVKKWTSELSLQPLQGGQLSHLTLALK